ncbi:translation elongation factor Ts [Candidatus Saccharibacteria bacterium]|nr:translation elongation factor Ts [Candidatus Saccharibacteria bacterium]
MTNILTGDIKRLRELTGVGITDAKQALVEAKGDFDKALAAMRKKGLTKANKRAEREARSGLIGTYCHDGRIGVVLEVNCETDFVAKTDEFKELVKDLCLHIAASEPQNKAELLSQPFVKNPEITVGDYVKQHNAKLGENIIVRRFERMALGEVTHP